MNRQAAVIGSMLLAAVMVLARETLVLSTQTGPPLTPETETVHPLDLISFSLLGPLSYVVLLFHWHSLRARLGYKRFLFVDKLCICQHDADKKSQGILGLAAFLRHSTRLVVLWSPTYFSRLWCTYELAAWFHFENELSSVLFVPVEIPPRLVYSFIFTAAISNLNYYLFWIQLQFNVSLGVDLLPILNAINSILFVYIAQGHVEHVGGLQQELTNFEVQRTACFCCTNDHRHPETGAPLECDRKMVYSTLREWIGTSGEDEDEHLSTFNDEVRTTLSQYVTRVLPERQLFLKYSDFVFTVLPIALVNLDYIIWRRRHGYGNVGLDFFGCMMDWLLVIPLTINLVIRMIYACHRRRGGGKSTAKVKALLAVCVWAPVHIFLVIALRMVTNPFDYLSYGVLWVYFIIVVILALVIWRAFATRAKALKRNSFSLGSDEAAIVEFRRHTAFSATSSVASVASAEEADVASGVDRQALEVCGTHVDTSKTIGQSATASMSGMQIDIDSEDCDVGAPGSSSQSPVPEEGQIQFPSDFDVRLLGATGCTRSESLRSIGLLVSDDASKDTKISI
eukprot:TRINITY_DN20633_c0_g1_i1.p1 TRINITY_DN20633_c0_g1~~TRINITY_DN20633_c0_g1_i1.p1  ORF type:complete len:567 (+),score=27.16 TRINITY_DN20633_c0_g1_i1:341-2041(+)